MVRTPINEVLSAHFPIRQRERMCEPPSWSVDEVCIALKGATLTCDTIGPELNVNMPCFIRHDWDKVDSGVLANNLKNLRRIPELMNEGGIARCVAANLYRPRTSVMHAVIEGRLAKDLSAVCEDAFLGKQLERLGVSNG